MTLRAFLPANRDPPLSPTDSARRAFLYQKHHTETLHTTHSPRSLADVICRTVSRLYREGLTSRDLVMHHMYVRACVRA